MRLFNLQSVCIQRKSAGFVDKGDLCLSKIVLFILIIETSSINSHLETFVIRMQRFLTSLR